MCKPEAQNENFHPVRTFIENTGFAKPIIDPEGKKDGIISKEPAMWVPQRPVSGFFKDVKAIDRTPARHLNTVFMFYWNEKVKYPPTRKDLLRQASFNQIKDDQFLEFMLACGYPVETKHHTGWTGRVESSWKNTPIDQNLEDIELEINPFDKLDGYDYALYHSDDIAETAFIMPGINSKFPLFPESKAYTSRIGLIWRTGRGAGQKSTPSKKILRDLTDHCCQTGLEVNKEVRQIPFIIIEPLDNGLFRVDLVLDPKNHNDKPHHFYTALPLLPNSIVCKTVLANLVRCTARNLAARESWVSTVTESFHKDSDIPLGAPPHAKRRQMVHNSAKVFSSELEDEQVICRLLNDASVEIEGIKKTTEVTNV